MNGFFVRLQFKECEGASNLLHEEPLIYCETKLHSEDQAKAVLRVCLLHNQQAKHAHCQFPPRSQTTTTTATLTTCRVRGRRCHIFNSSNFHSRSSKSTKRRLSTRARGFGAVTYPALSLYSFLTDTLQ